MELDKWLLTPEEIDLIEWESAMLDMRFVDDNEGGVNALLRAQITSLIEKGWKPPEEIKLLLEQAKQEERERVKRLLLDPEWGTMCEDNGDACPACKHFWQALKEE